MTEKWNEKDYDNLEIVLRNIAASFRLAQVPWLLGGSCGIGLQGVSLERAPRDIDVYCDRDVAQILHEQLAAYALDVPTLDESGSYTSVLSHYQVGVYTLELVGGFEIRTGNSQYTTEISNVLFKHAPTIELAGVGITLMPLAHELIFNILRERSDRYNAIANAIRQAPDAHIELVKQLFMRNRLSADVAKIVAELLNLPELYDAEELMSKSHDDVYGE